MATATATDAPSALKPLSAKQPSSKPPAPQETPAVASARLTYQLRIIQQQAIEMVKNMQSGPATPEQEDQLQMLQEALRQVEAQQMELKKSVDVITQKKQKEEVERQMTAKEKARQAAEKERSRITKQRPAEKVRMSDLREANKAELDKDDLEARQKAVQPVGFIPSGGLTGFRVASDLAKMDFAPRTDLQEEPEEEEPPKHVTPAWLKPPPATESS